MGRLAALGVLTVAVLAFVSGAGAATFTHDCDPADTGCLALAERLEQLDADTIANGAKLDAINDTLGAQAGQPVTGTVALGGDAAVELSDTRRLLGYLLGLVAALIFTHTFWRTFGRST